MTRLLTLTAVLLLASVFARAQEPSLKPSSSERKAEAPALLSLEVDFKNSRPPAYISVRGPEKKPRWIWAPSFARIPGARPEPGLPILALRIEAQFNGETADVKVSLFRGNTGFEREDAVATYHLGFDEKTTVNELQAFGLVPIDLTLLNVVAPLPPPPAFENRTMSIAVVSVESDNVPLPTYKLTLRNQSEKNIHALSIEVISDGRPRLSTLWQNEFDRPVIEAGAFAEKSITVATAQKTPTAYAPGAATNNTIIIRTAVFDDLSFDGDEQAACQYEKFVVGRRLWLKRVLPLIEGELANRVLAPREFKAKFLSLTYKLEDSEKTGESAVSSKCEDPDLFVHVSTQGLTIELVRELDRIINTRPAPPIDFRVWLESKRDDYQNWLARLN